jgi:hypothetical protein
MTCLAAPFAGVAKKLARINVTRIHVLPPWATPQRALAAVSMVLVVVDQVRRHSSYRRDPNG